MIHNGVTITPQLVDDLARVARQAIVRVVALERDAPKVRGQLDVAISLLRECVGPLEVSAASIESDDDEAMGALIGRVKRYLHDADAQAQAQCTQELPT